MELRHLRYFIGVAEEENISRAALKLHVSQPALSRQIRDLEEELGILLLQRSAKSVRLTEAGRVFSREARGVLARADEAILAARAAARGREIHVGYAPSLTVEILPATLKTLQKTHPEIQVILHDLSTEGMLAALRDGTIDVALLVQPSPSMLRGLGFEELIRYPLCVALPPDHALADRRSVGFDDVIGESLIGYSRKEYPEYATELAKLVQGGKKRLRIDEEHDSVTSLIAAVESGRGVALVPSCLRSLVGARLKLIPLRPAAFIVVGRVWSEKVRLPHAEPFLRALSNGDAKS